MFQTPTEAPAPGVCLGAHPLQQPRLRCSGATAAQTNPWTENSLKRDTETAWRASSRKRAATLGRSKEGPAGVPPRCAPRQALTHPETQQEAPLQGSYQPGDSPQGTWQSLETFLAVTSRGGRVLLPSSRGRPGRLLNTFGAQDGPQCEQPG